MSSAALASAGLLMLTLLALRRRQRTLPARARADALDTVAAWPPEATRVQTVDERRAFALLADALPDCTILAQVPLARFVRVPTRHSYSEWLQRVGRLNADLLVCDGDGRVRAVVDLRAPQETERSRRRHERLARVLRAAGVRVHVWQEDRLPTAAEVRHSVAGPLQADAGASASQPMPLIPVPEIAEVLAAGDRADYSAEPVASGFFDDLEAAAAVAAAPSARRH